MAANQWVKVELYGANNDGCPRRYTIADATSVSKGDLLELITSRTASAAGTSSCPVAGVAAEDHEANVGVTSISCWTDGVFNATASGTINVGDYVNAGGTNVVQTTGAVTLASGARVIGHALNKATNGNTCIVRLRL